MKNYSENKLISTTTYISSSTLIEADLEADNIVVDGTVIGDIKSKYNFVLGASGSIKGNISADNIDIHGECSGNIYIKQNLYLGKKAKVFGNIVTNYIKSESGSKIKGHIKVTGDNESKNIEKAEQNIINLMGKNGITKKINPVNKKFQINRKVEEEIKANLFWLENKKASNQ